MKSKLVCSRPLRFSWHARFESLPIRTLLRPRQILEILSAGLTIPIGVENRKVHHELFFSILDNEWYVAIINRNINEVITLLPIHYHHRWEISEGAKQTAREIALSGNNKVPIGGEDTGRQLDQLKIYAILDNGQDQKLAKECWPNNKLSTTFINDFWADPSSTQRIRDEIIKVNLPLDRITAIEARNKTGFRSEAPEDTLSQILWP